MLLKFNIYNCHQIKIKIKNRNKFVKRVKLNKNYLSKIVLR